MAMMAGAGQVTEYEGIVDEFSKCWGYLDHLGKVAKNASFFMEGTMEDHSMVGDKEGLSVEGTMGRVGFTAGNTIEKSQVEFIATFVEKIMIEYNKAQEPKVKIRCNFYNRGFCRKGSTCDFEHPVKLCEQYKLEGECTRSICKDRHIYKCKYFQSQKGCFRGSSCEFLHANVGVNDEEDLNEIDAKENVEFDNTNDQVEVDNQIKIPAAAIKDITAVATTTNENVDNKVDDRNEIKNHREVLEDESDGFLLLENAIADGIELDDDILDKILEAMEKKEVSKEEKKVKEKKVKEKKVKGKKVKEKKAKKASRKLSTSLTN